MKRLIVLFALCASLLLPASALAYNPFGQACKAGGTGSTACTANGTTDPISGPNGLLKKITIIVAEIAGIAAIIVIIISGFQFMTSGGDSQKAAGARSTLIGAIIGLVIIIAAQAILVFILNKV
jgi:hypothetical protein